MEHLNTPVGDGDPAADLTHIEHLMQTSEAIRRDGHPRWMVLAGLIHYLGKVLCLWGEPQWGGAGDTFPVGCAYSDKVVFPELFEANPDIHNPEHQTPAGIYEPAYGLDRVHMSWGHDEFVYLVTRDHLMSPQDREMFHWVRLFNPYDLDSKSACRPDAKALRPYYEDLIAGYFTREPAWVSSPAAPAPHAAREPVAGDPTCARIPLCIQ